MAVETQWEFPAGIGSKRTARGCVEGGKWGRLAEDSAPFKEENVSGVQLDFRPRGGSRFMFPPPPALPSKRCLMTFSPNKAETQGPSAAIKAGGPDPNWDAGFPSWVCAAPLAPTLQAEQGGPAAPLCDCEGSKGVAALRDP